MSKPSVEKIQTRAHQLWEAAGRPDGREVEFWHQAENELSGDPANNPDERSDTFIE